MITVSTEAVEGSNNIIHDGEVMQNSTVIVVNQG